MTLPEPQKLTPEQECIMTLAAIIAAVHFESSDEVTQQFVTMMVSQAAQEYQQTTQDKLSVALFTPPLLTAKFREAMVLMRQGFDEMKNHPNKIIRPTQFPVSKNGKHKI
jgi:hypothetical protein